MLKKIFFIPFVVTSLLASCGLGDNITEISSNIDNSGSTSQGTSISIEEMREQKTQEAIQSKIETIRKRLALKGLIIDGDGYYRDGQIALALVKYLEFYRKNPEDQLILEKLGDAYYSLHKYSSSYSYYTKIQDPSKEIQDKIALSLIHEIDFNDIASISSAQTTLKNTLSDENQLYYYNTSLDCAIDFHNCKLTLNNYFWPEEGLESQSGSINNIPYGKLSDLKSAIENYRNFRVDEVYLKDAYIVASWYSNDLYKLSAHMGENILGYKPGYKPILKIVAQSYFELGKYEASQKILSKYQDIDDQDPAVNYMLGIIYTQLRDYVLANIHLAKAIKLGSPESLEIRRQLIHNFYQLNNESNILKEFQNLVENEDDYTAHDLGLGIYNHILEGDYETALSWSKLGIKKFSEQAGDFYAYEAWILREKGEFELADSILQLGKEKYPDNAFITINLGYTALLLEKKAAAVTYFKTVLKKHPNTEFAVSAQQELDILSEK